MQPNGMCVNQIPSFDGPLRDLSSLRQGMMMSRLLMHMKKWNMCGKKNCGREGELKAAVYLSFIVYN
jgi:hypothetical protein